MMVSNPFLDSSINSKSELENSNFDIDNDD